MGVQVVGLGAWCDNVTEDEYGDELACAARPPELVKQSLEAAARTLQFRVEEFADLSDGRRLTLTDDRGWSTSLSGGRPRRRAVGLI